MLVIGWEEFLRQGLNDDRKSAATIGVFDGIHRGHRALVERITKGGKPLPAPRLSLVVSFKQNPRRLFLPEGEIFDIMGLDEKIGMFETLGIDALVLIDFSLDFCRMDGVDFIKTLAEKAGMAYLAIGRDFKCGYGGLLDAERIKGLCETLGVVCEVVQPVLDDGLPVSSSRIRDALAAGDRTTAERLLGRKLGEWKIPCHIEE
jgi:riboflavin kinase/FMN adenylyltransferase